MAPETRSGPCACEACTLAGCDRPPVTLGASRTHPQRELHGRELRRFYEDQDRRKALFEQLRGDLQRGGRSA